MLGKLEKIIIKECKYFSKRINVLGIPIMLCNKDDRIRNCLPAIMGSSKIKSCHDEEMKKRLLK